ncbi:hypothetical protein GCK32_005152 [Trichostrongylus colubriformis]|uniref:Uncharacterized protein n=1 Tax=Trichostrongylus colubriformis TaxID=6319 RepID=A0AAN8F1P8_TRICO
MTMTSPIVMEVEEGLKLIAGQSVGTETIRCDNSQAYCYNMSANAAALIDIVKVGCSMWRCMLARDKCISTTFQNIPISLCCCSTNLCNVPENRGIRHQSVQGWNTQPEREQTEHEERWTSQQMAQLQAMDLDDDRLNDTVPSTRPYSADSDGDMLNDTLQNKQHPVVDMDDDLLNSTLRINRHLQAEIQIP